MFCRDDVLIVVYFHFLSDYWNLCHAKVNKNLKLAKENRENVSTCTNFHYIISSWKKWATTEWRNCRRKPKRYTANCNMEIAILLSKKEFLKNSSLVTRNAVSRYALGVYNADSPYATRHPTRHQNLCILLIMWVLYAWFAISLLVTLKKVTSELTLQLILCQIDMLCEGDEWVTSALKWITAVTERVTTTCSVEGDELTSVAKILFFLVHLSRLYLRSVLPPF